MGLCAVPADFALWLVVVGRIANFILWRDENTENQLEKTDITNLPLWAVEITACDPHAYFLGDCPHGILPAQALHRHKM